MTPADHTSLAGPTWQARTSGAMNLDEVTGMRRNATAFPPSHSQRLNKAVFPGSL